MLVAIFPTDSSLRCSSVSRYIMVMEHYNPATQPEPCKQTSVSNTPCSTTHDTSALRTDERVQTSLLHPPTTEIGSEVKATGTDPSIATATTPILCESAGHTSDCAETSIEPQDQQHGEGLATVQNGDPDSTDAQTTQPAATQDNVAPGTATAAKTTEVAFSTLTQDGSPAEIASTTNGSKVARQHNAAIGTSVDQNDSTRSVTGATQSAPDAEDSGVLGQEEQGQQPGDVDEGAITPVSPDDLTKLTTDVASFIEEFKRLDAEIAVTTSGLNHESAVLEEKATNSLNPLVARMWSLLSQRGDLRKRLRSDELSPEVAAQLHAQIEELPGWTEWYENYRASVKHAASLRTVQRDLEKLNRKAPVENIDSAEEADGADTDGAKDTDYTEDSDRTEGGSENSGDDSSERQTERAELKTASELLAEHAHRMLEVLTGKSIRNDAMRISRAAELAEDLQRTIKEGKLFDSAPVVSVLPPQPPPVRGDRVPEPDPGTIEELRQRISRVADTSVTTDGQDSLATTVPTPTVPEPTPQPEKRQMPPWAQKTPDGTSVEEANSFFQKFIRRGDELAAGYWIRQLYYADRKVWKKLFILCSEDVGLADLSIDKHVLELEQIAEKCKDERHSDLLMVMKATMLICRAEKSRAVDNAIIYYNQHPTWKPPTDAEIEHLAHGDLPRPEIPDAFYDMHTTAGRRMGRGIDHFLAEGAMLSNESDVVGFVAPPTANPLSEEIESLKNQVTELTAKNEKLAEQVTTPGPIQSVPTVKPTLAMWKAQVISRPKCNRKYYEHAIDLFLDGYAGLVSSCSLQKVLDKTGPKYADDQSRLAAALRAAADNLRLLADAMEPVPPGQPPQAVVEEAATSTSPEPEPKPQAVTSDSPEPKPPAPEQPRQEQSEQSTELPAGPISSGSTSEPTIETTSAAMEPSSQPTPPEPEPTPMAMNSEPEPETTTPEPAAVDLSGQVAEPEPPGDDGPIPFSPDQQAVFDRWADDQIDPRTITGLAQLYLDNGQWGQDEDADYAGSINRDSVVGRLLGRRKRMLENQDEWDEMDRRVSYELWHRIRSLIQIEIERMQPPPKPEPAPLITITEPAPAPEPPTLAMPMGAVGRAGRIAEPRKGWLIYPPKGAAHEYCQRACNQYIGCDGKCLYCYGPGTLHISVAEYHDPRLRGKGDFFKELQREAEMLDTSSPIQLSFLTDPYCGLDLEAKRTRHVIEILHRYGHSIRLLTKFGRRSLRDLDLMSDRDYYGVTLTCLDPIQSKHWEPGAAPPDERLEALRKYYMAGIPTEVSFEPVLYPAHTLELIKRVHEITDGHVFHKVGKLNSKPNHPQFIKDHERSIDWAKFAAEAVELLESLGARYMIKEDLQKYLSSPTS